MPKKIFVDGSGWNGRVARFIIAIDDGEVFETRIEKRMTNNEIEYLAVIEAFKYAKDGDVIFSDSKVVVNQIKGIFACKKKHLFKSYMRARQLYNTRKVKLQWVSREENLAGKLLER